MEPTAIAPGGDKLITDVYYQLNTKAFDQDAAFFNQLSGRFGAKIESINQGINYYDNRDSRYLYVTYRVPVKQLDAFLAELEKNRIIANKNFNQYDVTDSYDVISARLAVLQASQKRYMELLNKAERVEDIIAVEQALTNITMEIDGLATQRDSYDKDIEFTRVSVNLTEVPKGQSIDGSIDFWTKLVDTFKRAIFVFWTGLQQILLFFVMLWPFILLILALLIGYKYWRKHKKPQE